MENKMRSQTASAAQSAPARAKEKEKELSFDEKLFSHIKELTQFHAGLSEKNMTLKNQTLDLACDKLASGITALNVYIKEKQRDGSYGKD